MKHNNLKGLIGVWIRRQYFNFPIYIFLSILLLAIEIVTFIPLFESDFNFDKWSEDVFASIFTTTIFIIPCIVFSVLNRFFFGKIVCVLNEQGIHYKDGIVKWNDILSIEYNITHFGRFYFRPAYIDVVCKNKTIQIESVPLYMFSAIKKFNVDIKTKNDKMIWVIVATIIITPIVISAVV